MRVMTTRNSNKIQWRDNTRIFNPQMTTKAFFSYYSLPKPPERAVFCLIFQQGAIRDEIG
jgi:hypothetical protein